MLTDEAWLLRYIAEEGQDRLLIVNLGIDLPLTPIADPLLAPVGERPWRLLWSSEDPRYGGCGTPPPETEENWRVPGEAAVVLVPGPPCE